MPRFLPLSLVFFTWVLVTAAAVAAPAEADYQRIVSMGPNLTETIFALGAGDRLVGVSEFCQWPEAARKLKRVGGPATPRLEVLAALRPDLIVNQFPSPAVDAFARERGIALIEFRMDSLDSINREIERLGALLGCSDAATSLTRRMQEDLAAISGRVEEIAPDPARRPLIFLSLERQPGSLAGVLSATGKSFLGEALALAGGRNALADLTRPYVEVSRESLAARRPELILELRARGGVSEPERRALAADWQAMSSLPAVRTGRIHVLDGDYLLVPGPRFPQIVRALHEAIYGAASN